MRKVDGSEMGPQEDERLCVQCKEIKPLTAFVCGTEKNNKRKKICCACELVTLNKRRHHLATQRDTWQLRPEWEARRRQEWERKVALRHEYEERWREQEAWYLEQPDRPCRGCQQVLPATAFGGIPSNNGFILHTRCKVCHEAMREQRQLVCCLCQKKTPHANFVSHYKGYALSCDGVWLPLCCQGCEVPLGALSDDNQYMYIQEYCMKAFPVGQVIYAEIDPEIDAICYVGRTNNPKRRHAQHLVDASPAVALWGKERKVWYTRGNWIYALAEKGLTPSMKILMSVDVSPLVVEWEWRYIWHGIQQGWPLLNVETMNDGLVARIKAAPFDFLTVPFETLVEQHFVPAMGLVAFLRKWCLLDT